MSSLRLLSSAGISKQVPIRSLASLPLAFSSILRPHSRQQASSASTLAKSYKHPRHILEQPFRAQSIRTMAAISDPAEDKVREHVALTFFNEGMVKGNWDVGGSVLADDVIWSVPSDSAIAGFWKGKEAVMGLGKNIGAGGVNVGVVRLEYGLEKIAVVLHNKGDRDGKVLDEHLTAVITVKDGKAVYIEAFISNLPMLNEFLPKKD